MKHLLIAISIAMIVMIPTITGALHIANGIKANLSIISDKLERATKP
jgi:hypothetical protein